jgi:hypothetical protein
MPNPACSRIEFLRGQCFKSTSRNCRHRRQTISAFAGKDPFERCVGQRRKKTGFRTGLACSRNYWSCGSLTGLPILQTHRPGLACSRDYWSCSPRPLTELPVLQTHVLVLPAQGVTGLAACSQDYLSCNSQARSCLLKGLLVLQPSTAHRVTCLANSRRGLAAQGITGLAALSSLTELPILQAHGLAARSALVKQKS